MFFDDEELAPKVSLRALPPVPETGWRRPTALPDLTRAKVIAFDLETKEPDFDHGPGWARGQGHIVGVSVCALDAHSNKFVGYYPVRHEVGSEDNFHPKQVFDWLRVQLQTPHIPKVGANLIYDVGWLTEEDIYVSGELHDVQFGEALLCERGDVNLEWLGQKYLGEGKASNAMYDWIDQAYRPAKKKRRGEIYRTPPKLVGHYAESDSDLPLRILELQWPLLQAEALDFIYRIECDLIYLLVRMRIAGVSVDVGIAEQMHAKLTQEISILYGKISSIAGRVISGVNSADELAPIFDAAGVKYKKTPTGKPSFTKEWLTACEHPVADVINSIRELEKLRGTFIEGYILERNVRGKLYGNFHPLRGDDGGARSGRFSSSNPNLQNIPSRSELGKKIRQIFVPDYGHACWEKDDYSQIEYRFLCHFAVGPGSEEVRQQYNDDPDTDYHEHTQDEVKRITGLTIPRKPIKNINFGLLYGMGKPKLKRTLNVGDKEGDDMFEAYHNGAPYVKATMEATSEEAQQLGYITTILGRRSRFELWEPCEVNYENRDTALPYEDAICAYGSQIQRAYAHKAINRRLQGSAADQIKYALWKAWRAGVFDAIGVPRVTVHDETGHSVIDDSPEQNEGYAEWHNIMETCLKLRVPVKVDSGRGPNWGAID